MIFNTDEDRPIIIPYYKICIYAFFLVIPLSIGLLIARYAPRLSKFLVRILKPMALFLILFILIFGVWANLYIFRLMTWPVFLTVSYQNISSKLLALLIHQILLIFPSQLLFFIFYFPGNGSTMDRICLWMHLSSSY